MKKQSGAALITAMVALLLVTLVSIMAIKSAGIQNRLAFNHESQKRVMNAVQGVANLMFTRNDARGLKTTLNAPDPFTDEFVLGNPEITINSVTEVQSYLDGTTCSLLGTQLDDNSAPEKGSCFFFSRISGASMKNGANAEIEVGFRVQRAGG